jgi:hypothetical protein
VGIRSGTANHLPNRLDGLLAGEACRVTNGVDQIALPRFVGARKKAAGRTDGEFQGGYAITTLGRPSWMRREGGAL